MSSMKFEIIIEKEFFYKEDNNFGIYSFKTEDDIPHAEADLFSKYKHSTILGVVHRLDIGSKYTVTAQPEFNEKFKKWQWKLLNIDVSVPKTIAEQQQFLSSLVTPLQAKNITDVYPNFVQDIISKKELDFSKVNRMNETIWNIIKGKVINNYGYIDSYILLKPYGVTISQIKALLKDDVYKNNPMILKEDLQKNPYILTKIRGFGFKKTDKIALQINPEIRNSRYRVCCFVEQYLKQIGEEEGHSCIEVSKLKQAIKENIPECLEIANDFLKEEKEKDTFLHIENQFLGLKYFYNQEKEILEKLEMLCNSNAVVLNNEQERKIIEAEKEQGFNFLPEQKQAIIKILNSNVSVLCGKAGTGKTTISRAILKILVAEGKTVACCSLSAKAAQRIIEATGFKATTIHKLLRAGNSENDSSYSFEYNKNNRLPFDVVFVDECSMVNLPIFHSLITALRDNCILILCGDNKQLPPIGCGNVFDNILQMTNKFNCITLNKVMRQAEKSGILSDANAIREGISPLDKPVPKKVTGELEDMCYMFRYDREEMFEIVIKNYLSGIQKYGIDNVVILSPRRQDCVNSVFEINHKIQDILLKDEENFVKYGNKTFKVGAKVINKKNNYEKNVVNGEVGYIKEILKDEKNKSDCIVKVNFVENNGQPKEVSYTVSSKTSELEDLELAYALTAHSAQGSGYDMVICVIDNTHYILLDRCMLYTMLTRAKKRCLLVCEPPAYKKCISDDKTTKRKTWISLIKK